MKTIRIKEVQTILQKYSTSTVLRHKETLHGFARPADFQTSFLSDVYVQDSIRDTLRLELGFLFLHTLEGLVPRKDNSHSSNRLTTARGFMAFQMAACGIHRIRDSQN